ncbi:MAG: alanine--tRNA ligase, partial [Evtepia gabavorous]
VSAMVNEAILEGYDVVTEELPIEQAKKKGAIALFGEKYGDVVRVVDMGEGYSVEFCGGTHLSNTAKVGVFHVSSEFSVASGVRRIEATTGKLSLEVMNRNQELLFEAAAAMKAKPGELREKAKAAMAEIKQLHQVIENLRRRPPGPGPPVPDGGQGCGELKVLTAHRPGWMETPCGRWGFPPGQGAQCGGGTGSTNEEKITFLAVCGKQAIAKGIKAGTW